MSMCIFVTLYVTPHSLYSNGQRIIDTTFWYFFFLLNAFYGGALTMFFTSTIAIPFEGIVDVMREYLEWKLIYKEGTEALFAVTARNDPDYAEYWERSQLNPKEVQFKTIKEGLDLINNN
jgi:hypothetical protein